MLANRSVLALAAGFALALLAAGGLTYWRYRRSGAELDRQDGGDRRYYRDVAAVGLLLALVAGFFWRPLFNRGVTMPQGRGDLVSFFYPIHVFASESLRAGQLPLWNPHLFSGMPFAADIQSGVFYPLNWLFWLLGRPVTYEKVEMLALVHYWLAASFSYALARSLKLGRWPAVVAGTLYAFSGFAVSHLGHLPMLATAAWLPLILLAANQAARRCPQARWRWPVATGLLLAVGLLAGHFQLFVYNFYAAVICWAAVAWRGRPQIAGPDARPRRRYWRNQAAGGLLAGLTLLGASLVQLWPFYELGQLSVRSAISYETSTQFGVWPVGLADLLLPNLFSPNPQEYFGYWSNTDVLGYMGLFTYALAGLAIFLRPAGRSGQGLALFLSLGLAGLIFSLSGYTIFQGWFYQFVPALNLTRGSGRFLVWFNLGFAMAAAFGLQAWLDYRAGPPEATAERALRWGWRALALLALALLLVPVSLLYAQMVSTPGNINDLVVRGLNGLIMAVIVLGLGAGLLRLWLRRRIGPDLAAGLALALLVFDLFSARSGFNPQAGDVANGFYHQQTAAFLRGQDPAGQYRLDVSAGSARAAWQANAAQLLGLYDVRGVFNPLQLAGYESFWNAVTSRQKDFRAVPAYNLLGARYVIARQGEDPAGPQFRRVYQDNRPGVQLNVFENSLALPRAWAVHRAEIKPAAEILQAALADDFQPGATVLLESGRQLEGATGTAAGETVRLVAQSANRLELEADLQSEGYIVINQAYYPGWRASLNGVETAYLRANYAFGAVYAPAGRQRLSLEFSPVSALAGGLVSGLTWLVALGWLAWPLAGRFGRQGAKFKS